MLTKPALYTDFYELTMAQGYFLSGNHSQKAGFDYFFRTLPFKGGYVVFAGLSDLLKALQNLQFHEDEIEYLRKQGFREEFLSYLKAFRFNGNIWSVQEGEIVFANEPILHVEANIIEAQIIETLILNILNFESLIATKASRIKQAAQGRPVLDFGLRRSQGTGGIQASKAAVIGGIDSTSNVASGYEFDIEVSGTMAHSWIQFFGDELKAFRTYAEYYPDSTTLLVDTYNTLKSGIPNAIKVAKELEEKGQHLKGVRLDSGDLAYLSRKSRQKLDAEGLDYVKIAASNQLDERVIKSLLEQKAPIDIFGVGTKLVTAYDDPALDGVYKLSSVNDKPSLKISENIEKTTLPGRKKIFRFYNQDGSFNSDGITLYNQFQIDTIIHPNYPFKTKDVSHLEREELLVPVIKNGTLNISIPTAKESAQFAKKQLMKLNPEHKRFDNPHVYKIGISKELQSLQDELIKKKIEP
ncbi:MAG: nicotinate phosphoribosyltransferase [Balneolaceae bacterium]